MLAPSFPPLSVPKSGSLLVLPILRNATTIHSGTKPENPVLPLPPPAHSLSHTSSPSSQSSKVYLIHISCYVLSLAFNSDPKFLLLDYIILTSKFWPVSLLPTFQGALRVTFLQSVSEFSHSVMSDSLQPHGLQHTSPPYPSPTTGVYSNSYPSSR